MPTLDDERHFSGSARRGRHREIVRGADDAVGDERAHEIAVLLFEREIDRRRGAAEAEAFGVDRLAEMAAVVSPISTSVSPCCSALAVGAAFEIVDDADAADGRASAGSLGRWSRCRG